MRIVPIVVVDLPEGGAYYDDERDWVVLNRRFVLCMPRVEVERVLWHELAHVWGVRDEAAADAIGDLMVGSGIGFRIGDIRRRERD